MTRILMKAKQLGSIGLVRYIWGAILESPQFCVERAAGLRMSTAGNQCPKAVSNARLNRPSEDMMAISCPSTFCLVRSLYYLSSLICTRTTTHHQRSYHFSCCAPRAICFCKKHRLLDDALFVALFFKAEKKCMPKMHGDHDGWLAEL